MKSYVYCKCYKFAYYSRLSNNNPKIRPQSRKKQQNVCCIFMVGAGSSLNLKLCNIRRREFKV
jgi:hypothetical protein